MPKSQQKVVKGPLCHVIVIAILQICSPFYAQEASWHTIFIMDTCLRPIIASVHWQRCTVTTLATGNKGGGGLTTYECSRRGSMFQICPE